MWKDPFKEINTNFIPCGAIKSEFIDRNLPEKECGRQFTVSASGHSHRINIYYYYPLLLCVVCRSMVYLSVHSTKCNINLSIPVWHVECCPSQTRDPRLQCFISVYLRRGSDQLWVPMHSILKFGILNSKSFFIKFLLFWYLRAVCKSLHDVSAFNLGF